MHWKLKAAIQNGVSLLPSAASYEVYYWMQRHFGDLRQTNPVNTLLRAVTAWKVLKTTGSDPIGKEFFELGTGRAPLAPIAYWLLGAKNSITVDINPYLKAGVIIENLHYMAENTPEIITLFDSLLYEERLDRLLHFYRSTAY